jgi:hypothetical protein
VDENDVRSLGDGAEFNPNPARLPEVQITIAVRQRTTGRQDYKNLDVHETSIAISEVFGINLNRIARDLYLSLKPEEPKGD